MIQLIESVLVDLLGFNSEKDYSGWLDKLLARDAGAVLISNCDKMRFDSSSACQSRHVHAIT